MSGGVWPEISKGAKELVKKMLCYDYKHRISARQALQDTWFENAPSKVIDKKLMGEALSNLRKFSAT